MQELDFGRKVREGSNGHSHYENSFFYTAQELKAELDKLEFKSYPVIQNETIAPPTAANTAKPLPTSHLNHF